MLNRGCVQLLWCICYIWRLHPKIKLMWRWRHFSNRDKTSAFRENTGQIPMLWQCWGGLEGLAPWLDMCLLSDVTADLVLNLFLSYLSKSPAPVKLSLCSLAWSRAFFILPKLLEELGLSADVKVSFPSVSLSLTIPYLPLSFCLNSDLIFPHATSSYLPRPQDIIFLCRLI